MIEYVLGGLLIALLAPMVVYVSVKLGTYAFFKARQVFLEEQNHKKEGRNG